VGLGRRGWETSLNVCTDSEFHMASNFLTRLQTDQAHEYKLKPSQLGVFISLGHHFIKIDQPVFATWGGLHDLLR